MADLRTNLASNLRRLCAERHMGVSQACRGIGINRSQFERYLEAKGLPHKRTAERICAFFGVTESALYAPPAAAIPERHDLTFDDRSELLDRFARPVPTLESGYYYTFFAVPREPAMVICSITIVRREENAVTFRRLTGLAEREGAFWSYAKGDHRGFIVERLNHLFFIALNEGDAREPSLLVLRWEPLSTPTLSGLATVMTEWGPASTTVVMRPCPAGMGLRQVLRAAHVHRLNDEFVDPIVSEIIKRRAEDAQKSDPVLTLG